MLRQANLLSFGHAALPTFDLGRADYVISFGADFLGTWNSPVAQSIGYGEMRQGRPGRRGKFVQVESRMSQTGANADEWIPCRPGTEGALALGIAHVILSEKLAPQGAGSRAGALIAGWSAGLPDFTPEAVEKQTGVSAAVITRLAHEITQSGSAAAMIGGAPLAHTNGLFNALAVNALESLVDTGRDQGPILGFTPAAAARERCRVADAGQPGEPQRVGAIRAAGQPHAPQMLLLYDANPIFSAPPALRIREAIAKIPYIVSFGSFIDETSAQADLILPDHAPLESWLDSVPESGSLQAVASLAPPAVAPLHDTRPMPDVLLGLAHQLGGDVAKALPWTTFDAMLRAAFVPLRTRGGSIDAKTDDDFWDSCADAGRLVERRIAAPPPDRRAQQRPRRRPSTRRWRWPRRNLPARPAIFRSTSCPTSRSRLAMARSRICPGCRSCPTCSPRRCGRAGSRSIPRPRERLGIQQGDLVEIASQQGSVRAAGDSFPGNRARHGRHAGGPGTREFRPLRQRPRREPALDSRAAHRTRNRFARLGGDPGEARARGRTRAGQADIVRGRNERLPARRRAALDFCGIDGMLRHGAERKDDEFYGSQVGHGGRSGPLHGLRSVRGRVPCGK